MNTDKAIKHLRWKFTHSGSKASKIDKESLNAIISSLNKQQNTLLSNNLNFCKLLIYNFKTMCLKSAIENDYKYIDLRIIYSKLRDAMDIDAKSQVDSLHKELQQIEMQGLIDSNNLNPKTISELITRNETGDNIRKMCKEFIGEL